MFGAMRSLHIFRAGSHSPMQGGTLDFSAADLAATAAAYDPARYEAPLVVGHPALNAPAYGWVEGLAARGEDLVATPRQVDASFAELVKGGRYKKISASFWSPNARDNPAPGVWSLRHVGFLGAVPPAVKGLREVAFGAADDGIVTIEFAGASSWLLGTLFSDIGMALSRLRDRLVGEAGAEEADRVISGAMLQRLAEQAGALSAAPVEVPPPPAFAAQPPEEVPVSDTDAAARLAALEQRERQLAEREAQVAQAAATARRAEAASFAENLVREARLPQGLAPRAAALLASLPDEGTVSFASGGATVTEAPAAALRALLTGLPKAVSFGGFADNDGPGGEAPMVLAEFGGMRVDRGRAEIHAQALAYMAKHPGTDYAAAAIAVERSAAA
jgi:hypothetical protein